MAKKQNLNPSDDDFGKEIEEEDNESVQRKTGELSDAEIKKLKNEYCTLKQKHHDAGSPLQTLFKKIEDKGEDRAAFKDAVQLVELEAIKGQAYWRALTRYLTVLGFFDQGDLVDEAEGKDIKTGRKKAA